MIEKKENTELKHENKIKEAKIEELTNKNNNLKENIVENEKNLKKKENSIREKDDKIRQLKSEFTLSIFIYE